MLEQVPEQTRLEAKRRFKPKPCARMEAFCLMEHAFGGSSMKIPRTKKPKEAP